jgi:DNA repair exonuclease SbcCD nuclease subunit
MKISILSDFHFGFAYTSEMENDSFDNVEEAMEKALESDLILIGGDIFDTRLPKTQTWANAIRILTKPLLKESTGVKLVECTKQLKEISKKTLNHLPVIALHGNHERRAKTEVNPVEVLENAGILIHLHCQTAVFEKNGVKVAIHGMSNVSERFAYDVLNQWNPKPLPNCVNILLLHQSIDPYVYSPLEPPTLNLSNLPKGFDLIIDGHIHTQIQEKTNGTNFIIPGSLTITQFQKSEAEIEKCFVKLDIGNEIKTEFIPLEKNRKFFYEEIKLEEKSVRDQIENKISDIVYTRNLLKPPVIRLRIFGKETEVLDQELRDIERKYAEKAILVFVKELESPEMTEKIEFMKNLREQKLSTEEIGLNLLKKNLEELQFGSTFDYEDMFRLLTESEVDSAFNILTGEQKTLTQILKDSLVNK